MKVVIFAEGIDGDIIWSCLKNKEDFAGFINQMDLETAKYDKKSLHLDHKIIIVRDIEYFNIIRSWDTDIHILIFYGRKAIDDIKQNLEEYKRVFDLKKYIIEIFRRAVTREFESHNRLSQIAAGRYINRDISFLENHSEKIVFLGDTDHTKKYLKRIKHKEKIWGVIPYDQIQSDKCFIKSFDDLLYEDLDHLIFYLMEKSEIRKTEGLLIDIGVKEKQIFKEGRRKQGIFAGTRPKDTYDPLIGYTRIDSDIPGFTIFGDIESKGAYRILTLGGSTSDPLLENIKSWSEYLFEYLSQVEGAPPIIIYAGGLAGYTVSQELLKLMRDGLLLKPDLVLSYSGVNDIWGNYDVKHHPFIKRYMPDVIEWQISHRKIVNDIHGNKITKINLGIEDFANQSAVWIKCESIMKAICKEFSIEFHGFLQPVSDYHASRMSIHDREKAKLFYDEVSGYIHVSENGWLHDFSMIFDKSEQVFFDYCHLRERGNRIVAKKIMPYVLQSIVR